MDFFTNLSGALSDAGKNVSQKAKDLTGMAKLNMDIRYKEDYIRRQYAEIGKAFFESHQEVDTPHSEEEKPLFESIALIKEAQADIAKMEEELAGLKNLKKCPVCGTMVDQNAQFCSKCGTKFEDAPAQEEDVIAEADVVDIFEDEKKQEEDLDSIFKEEE